MIKKIQWKFLFFILLSVINCLTSNAAYSKTLDGVGNFKYDSNNIVTQGPFIGCTVTERSNGALEFKNAAGTVVGEAVQTFGTTSATDTTLTERSSYRFYDYQGETKEQIAKERDAVNARAADRNTIIKNQGEKSAIDKADAGNTQVSAQGASFSTSTAGSSGNGQAATGPTPSSAVSFDEAAISNAVNAAVAAEAGSSFYDVKRTRCMSDEMYNDAVKWMNDYKTEALKIVASNTDTYQRALASTGSSDIVPPMGAMTNVIRDAKMNGGQSVHSSTAGYLISSPQAVSYANTGVAPSNTSGPSAGSFSTNAVYAEIFASLDSANGGGAYAAAFSAYAAGNQNGVFTAFGNAGITGPNIAAALAAVADAKADDDAEKAAAAAAAAEAASSL